MITMEALGELRRSVAASFEPEAYRAHLRAQEFRVRHYEPTVEMPPTDALKMAKDLLERNGFTVVPTRRIDTVDVAHRFDWRELEAFGPNLPSIIESVSGSLAGMLGVRLVDNGGALFHDRTSTMERVIGYRATLIVPEKA